MIEEIIKKYLETLGFQADAVVGSEVKEENGVIKVNIKINTQLYADVPFLSGGRILAIFQKFVDQLPRESEGKKLDWLFVPAEKIEEKEVSADKNSELEMGRKVEREHTETIKKYMKDNVNLDDVVESIAKDHLKEMKDYYTKLKEMENKGSPEQKPKKGTVIKLSDQANGQILNTVFGKIGEEAMKTGLLDIAIAYQIGKHLINELFPPEPKEKKPFWR